MNNIFLKSWSKKTSCLRHSRWDRFIFHRIKTWWYKISRAYGSIFDYEIPINVEEKIAQLFFTCKGLEWSYDIIRAHGGEIKVESKEKEGLPSRQAGNEFIILLPNT